MRRLGRFLVWFLALVGLLTLAIVVTSVWAVVAIHKKVEPPLPSQLVMTLDLDGEFREAPSSDPFARLSGEKSYVMGDVVRAIDRAAGDPRVLGLFATLGHTKLGMASTQEVRDAVARFRASGKPAVVFAETMGEFGGGTVDYYLASAFGQVWLQPSGDVGLTGIAAESPFLKGTFDLLGIDTRFSARHEYKGAIEAFTRNGFSDPARDNVGRLLDSFLAQAVDGIAAARNQPPEKVRALMGSGPLLASEALSAGLVDKLGYREDALAAVRGAGKPKEVDLADYAEHLPKGHGTRVAVITGTGAIHRGKSEGPFGSDGFGSDTIAEAFRAAVDDPAVKAILFRVDSPGGSYVASDTVWNEVRRARAAGKPVVASMGGVAASGGYFVSMGADRVVAQPGTITGSIGVFAGKFVLADFWKKIGVSWDEVHRGGDNAHLWSPNRDFTPQAWDRLNAMLDRIYTDFTAKAAQGRNLPAERMDALARGRVWSGADAHRQGLVDVLGGWTVALSEVRGLLKLAPDAELDLVPFPQEKEPWKLLAKAFSGGSEARTLARAVAVLQPLAARLEALDAAGADLRMPPLTIEGRP
ncbi:MAG: signal peptide peptidase SppA [Solirubrobacterales bacterium]